MPGYTLLGVGSSPMPIQVSARIELWIRRMWFSLRWCLISGSHVGEDYTDCICSEINVAQRLQACPLLMRSTTTDKASTAALQQIHGQG